MMSALRFCFACVVTGWLLAATGMAADRPVTGAREGRPNILFILTDDQGWPTLSSYGNRLVATPHLDSLARDGVRFTDAYVMPQCTPTRASLLSGQHTARNGMWHVIPWYGSPWAPVTELAFREQFPRDAFNLAKGLRAAGYATGMAGKWHLTTGADGDYTSLKPAAASSYGFDYVAPRGPGSQNEGDKWVEHLTNETIAFMDRERDRPWFFYLSHHTLHNTVAAPADLVAKYRARGAPATGRHNATYLACIEHLDNSVGRLLQRLDELKLRDNTIVVFLSDNGGIDTSYAVPGLVKQPEDGSVPLQERDAQFDNAPLRAGKGSPYEGGIRVPCLVRWPQVARAGWVSAEPVHVVDWLPTLLAAAGAKSPSRYVVDGIDIRAALAGRALPERALYWYLPLYDLRWAATPSAVIRAGDWKLVWHFGDSFDEGRYRSGERVELFNLKVDPGETDDRSRVETDRATRLRTQLLNWIRSVPAPVPAANPHAERARYFAETKEKQPWNR